MRVVIHHLPTGCTWNIKVETNPCDDFRIIFSKNGSFDIEDIETKRQYFFPSKVLSESVVRIEE